MSSNAKRLWVINHYQYNFVQFSRCSRRNTGNEFATSFSNSAQSYKSSLDFMLQAKYTAENKITRLDGLEKALITLEKERLLYMEQNMFLVRYTKQ
jgi:hypothetical protein